MEEVPFTFVVQKVDFWQVLLSDSSWGLLGMLLYFLIVYRTVILKSNLFKILWDNKNLIGYSFTLTTVVAVVYRSFPEIQETIKTLPFYNDYLGKLGFVGISAMVMRFANGDMKDKMKTDVFKKATGFDPNEDLIK